MPRCRPLRLLPYWLVVLAATAHPATVHTASAQSASAQSATAHSASVQIDADSLRVGERFSLVVTVAAQGTVLPLDSAFAGPDVAIGKGDVRTVLDDQGRITTTLTYDAAAFALDTLLVRPITVRVVNSVDTLVLTTAPVAVRMQRLVPEGPEARLRPPRAPFPFGPPLWLWVLLAAALAALLAWRWRRRQPPAAAVAPEAPPRLLTPLEALVQHLDALDRTPPAPGADARPYFDTLTDAFRTYLETRLNVPAREQTSRELVARIERLERAGTLHAGAGALARDLFRVSDLARFADVRPGPQAARIAVDQARTLARYVEQSRSAPRPAPLQGVPRPRPAAPQPS